MKYIIEYMDGDIEYMECDSDEIAKEIALANAKEHFWFESFDNMGDKYALMRLIDGGTVWFR